MRKRVEKIIEILKPLLGAGLLLFGVPMAFVGGEWSKLYIILSLPFFIFGILYLFGFLSEEKE